jgi:hypothetical protein
MIVVPASLIFLIVAFVHIATVECDSFAVSTVQLSHTLSQEDHLTGADPDPGCSITMRLSWLSENSTACIFKEDDSTGIVPFVSDVISVELGDAPSDPSVVIWLDCFENDCNSGCVFDASCKIGLTGILTQEDDVREQANATFKFLPNRTETVDFKLQLYSVRFDLRWTASSSAPIVTPAPSRPVTFVTEPIVPTTNNANGGKSDPNVSTGSSTMTSSPTGASNTIAIAVGVVVGVVLLCALVGGLFACKRRSRSNTISLNEIESKEQTVQKQQDPQPLPYADFNPIAATTEHPTLQEWEHDAARISNAKAKSSAPPMSTIGKYDSVPDYE